MTLMFVPATPESPKLNGLVTGAAFKCDQLIGKTVLVVVED